MSRNILLSFWICVIIVFMRNRRNYTHAEARTVLVDWVRRKNMNPAKFHRWLEENGVTITRQYCQMLLSGKLCVGPKFKQVFKEITGITLIDGLIEREKP